MTELRFDIIFRGDILPGHQLMQVKAQLAQLFKADEQKINSLFSGGAVALKRNLEQGAAEKYRAALRKAGADVQVASAGSVKTSAARAVNKPAAAKPQRAVTPAARMTLKERLALAGSAEEIERPVNVEPAKASEQGFNLLPLGSDLLDDSERQVVQSVDVDISSISLRPQEGNLLDESEVVRAEPLIVDADFDLGELGADILLESEKRVLPESPVELPDVDIAPAGSDLGQIQAEAPPPPPDTSRISIKPL